MEQETVYFGENGIIKSAFHKTKIILILMMQILKRQYYTIKTHMVQIHLTILLDTDIKALPSRLSVKLPQMNAYGKYLDKNSKYMSLLVNDKEIFEKKFN